MTEDLRATLQNPARIAALRRLTLLDSPTEPAFDRLTRLASKILQAPVALVSLVDAERQFFKSAVGLPEPWASARETPLSHSFCQYAVATGAPFIVTDARAHPLVADNLAVPDLGAVAYAGIPLTTTDGHALGSFCVIDTEPRDWTEEDVATLQDLAAMALTEIELRRTLITERREAEEAIRFQAHLLDVIEQAVIATDQEGTIIYWNRFAEILYGWIEAEAVGQDLVALVGDESTLAHAMAAMACVRAGESWSGEVCRRRRDGTTFPALVTLSPILDTTGQVIGIVGVSTDITARKRAEMALQDSEARYRAIVADQIDLICRFLPDGTVTFANDSYCRCIGTTYAELLGSTIDTCVRDAHMARIRTQVAALTPEHATIASEAVLWTPAGEQRWIQWIDRALFDAEGHLIEIQAVGRDITEHKQAEAAIRENEARLRTVTANVPVILYVLNQDGVFTFADGRGLEVAGLHAHDLIGASAWDLFVDYPEIRAAIHRALSGESFDAVCEWRERTFEVGYRPLTDASGAFEGVIGAAFDITERTRAEAALRASEQRYQMLAEVSPVGIFRTDAQGATRYVNRRWCEITGLSTAEALGDGWAQALHPADRECVSREWEQARQLQRASQMEYRFRHRDGRATWVLGQAVPEKASDGTVVGYIGTITDITERRQAEEDLRASQRFVQHIADTLPAVLYVYDLTERRNVYINRAIREMLGYSESTIQTMGKSLLANLLHPDDLPVLLAYFDHRFLDTHDGEVLDVEYRIQHADGTYRWFYSRDTVFSRDAGGVPRQLLGTAQDITARKQAEAAIQRNADRAEALARTAAFLNAQLDLDAVLNVVCHEAARALHLPTAVVLLYDHTRDVLTPAATIGVPPECYELYQDRDHTLPRATYDWLVGQCGPVGSIADVQALPLLPNADLLAALDFRSLIGASLLRDGHLIGVLSLMTIGEQRHFTEDELSLLQALADQAAQAIVNAQIYMESQRRLSNLQALRTIDRAITASLDVNLTLTILLDQVLTQLGVDAAAVLLLDPQTLSLRAAAGRGFRTNAHKQTHLRLGEGYAGQAALERRMIKSANLREARDEFVRAALLHHEDFIAYYGVPLIAKGQVQGVLELFHRAPLNPTADWFDFLEMLARQAAISIDNATLFDRLQRSNLELTLAYDTTLEGWSRALDLRDKETEGHTQRVTELTVRLARALGLSEADVVQVRRGALLHDIGKMGIPDAILLKPGKLTDEEWVIMRQHPTYAYEMLFPITYLRPALDIPYCHHEKWDGTGYPRGLKGEQIPLAARIFAVVDVWDALRSDRPYRKGWSDTQVCDHIRSLAGTHFDPQVVETFLRMMEEEVNS